MSEKVVLFDLPSRAPCKTWSLNPWKTRLLLNYKNIPYETKWIEYPDVAPLLSQHVKPNPEGSFALYTIPTVILPDGTYLQESFDIANKLSELFPNPALEIETDTLKKIKDDLLPKISSAAAPEYMYRVPTRLLTQVSETWWYPDRLRRTGGQKLDDLQHEKGGEVAARAAAPHVKAVTDLLREKPGPFFEGDKVTYVDFVWVGFLLFLQRMGPDVFDLLVGDDQEAHLQLLEACRPWSERADH